MYAALRAIPIPDEVVARLFHAASLLREHRGDGHVAALMTNEVGGLVARGDDHGHQRATGKRRVRETGVGIRQAD